MANFNFNKVFLGGRLTGDPELRTTPSGVSVVSFTIAVNRRGAKEDQQQADFIAVTAWKQTAEFINKYFRKASSICIEGSIQTRTYMDKNNVRQYRTDVVANDVTFVDSKGMAHASALEPPQDPPKFEVIDDDTPF